MRGWDWNKYIEATKTRKPVHFLAEAVTLLGNVNGHALDLGCGAGVDSRYLANNGFIVEAVDSNESAILHTQELCRGLSVQVIQEDIAKYRITTNAYRLILSWFSVPFVSRGKSGQLLADIQEGLMKGGMFVFALLGPEDEWAKTHPEMSFFTIEELKQLLPKLHFAKVLEEKQTAPGVTGEVKFWHKIQGIARR